ncbi:hypothetical protein V4P56_01170 [Bartonella sp. B35(2025)]
MAKLFKNHVLGICISVAFFLSQIVSVNANYLKNNSQQSEIFTLIVEQGRSKATSMTTLHAPSLNYEVENETIIEGKIEKVIGPITIGLLSTAGAFSFGCLTGSVMAIVSAIIGWAIGVIKKS